jgi:serine/threonine protein kinase
VPRPFVQQAFGKYTLCDKLAVGGMAEIFLARLPAAQPGSFLVIKRILPHYSGNSQFTDMFIDEARISFLLRHENIVPLHDLGKVENQFFLAMEWIPGQDLKAVVTRCRERGLRLSPEHAAWICSETLKGLEYAHSKTAPDGRPLHIVHRDVSPQNVLVGYDGAVKITDFGIAKAESKLDSTQVGTLKGKFGYMAPEQVIANGPPLDSRADVFAVGIILWELLTGQRLFTGATEIEILEKVRSARFDPPSSFVTDVPRELEKVVFHALMRDRDKRYLSAGEMQADLARFLDPLSGFGRANVAAVMAELFADEIESLQRKWNVTVIDRDKTDEGARLESTRGDARVPAATNPSANPFAGSEDVATTTHEVPVRRDETGKTKVNPPPPDLTDTTRRPVVGKTQLSGGGLSAEELLAGIEEEKASEDLLASAPPPSAPTPAQPSVTSRRASRDATTTHEVSRAAKPRGRGAFWAACGGVALIVGAAGGVFSGAIQNPFASPMVEVVCTVECMVKIDGGVVLASGTQGRWPVGEGDRVVEISRIGYQPITRTVHASRGTVLYVDGTLLPVEGALADIPIDTEPAGSEVWLDAVKQDGSSPLTVHASLGDHTLRVSRPRYQDSVISIPAKHPGTCPPVKVALSPKSAAIQVGSTPPGAKVFVDGALAGVTPWLVDGLPLGKPVTLDVTLKGYRS